MEFVRVIEDGDEGPILDLKAASTPPPNAFALFVTRSYAMVSDDKRRELISRALAFACKSTEDAPGEGSDKAQGGGFLDDIGEKPAT
jgi:hypothetical protein